MKTELEISNFPLTRHGGKLKVSEDYPLYNLKFQNIILSHAFCKVLHRVVEIVKFSSCPGTSKKPKCTCP